MCLLWSSVRATLQGYPRLHFTYSEMLLLQLPPCTYNISASVIPISTTSAVVWPICRMLGTQKDEIFPMVCKTLAHRALDYFDLLYSWSPPSSLCWNLMGLISNSSNRVSSFLCDFALAFPSPGMLFPLITTWLTPSLCLGHALIPPQRSLPWLL